jgi:hypothetical protein
VQLTVGMMLFAIGKWIFLDDTVMEQRCAADIQV